MGLVIKVSYDGDEIPVVYVGKENGSTYFKSEKDNFQTYVIGAEDFKDFIYLLDEAFLILEERCK